MKYAITYKDAVATYAGLPVVGNVQGDVRTAMDTGIQYYWSNAAVAGVLTDWKMLNDNIPSTVNECEKLNIELETAYKAAYLTRYKEFTYVGDNLTAVDIYDTPAKTNLLFSKTLTYIGPTLTQTVLTRASDGRTLTKDFAYTGDNLTSVTIS